MYSSGPRCCNLSWLPLVLWREVSLEIFQIRDCELVITWISDYARLGLSKSSQLTFPLSQGWVVAWGQRHPSLGGSVLDGVLLLEGRIFGPGMMIHWHHSPWGHSWRDSRKKKKKKKSTLMRKGIKSLPAVGLFLRTIKFTYWVLLLWFELSQTSSIKYPP